MHREAIEKGIVDTVEYRKIHQDVALAKKINYSRSYITNM